VRSPLPERPALRVIQESLALCHDRLEESRCRLCGRVARHKRELAIGCAGQHGATVRECRKPSVQQLTVGRSRRPRQQHKLAVGEVGHRLDRCDGQPADRIISTKLGYQLLRRHLAAWRHDDERDGVVVADVAGKGVVAALAHDDEPQCSAALDDRQRVQRVHRLPTGIAPDGCAGVGGHLQVQRARLGLE
jgi:hypothetical protein